MANEPSVNYLEPGDFFVELYDSGYNSDSSAGEQEEGSIEAFPSSSFKLSEDSRFNSAFSMSQKEVEPQLESPEKKIVVNIQQYTNSLHLTESEIGRLQKIREEFNQLLFKAFTEN
jgi:hypothetical protein